MGTSLLTTPEVVSVSSRDIIARPRRSEMIQIRRLLVICIRCGRQCVVSIPWLCDLCTCQQEAEELRLPVHENDLCAHAAGSIVGGWGIDSKEATTAIQPLDGDAPSRSRAFTLDRDHPVLSPKAPYIAVASLRPPDRPTRPVKQFATPRRARPPGFRHWAQRSSHRPTATLCGGTAGSLSVDRLNLRAQSGEVQRPGDHRSSVAAQRVLVA